MKQFMVFYKSEIPAEQQLRNRTIEDVNDENQAWDRWIEQCGRALLDVGSPLGSGVELTATSQTIKKSAGKIVGYSIMQAKSLSELIQLLEAHPHLHIPGGEIKVQEILFDTDI